ncbi:Embryo-specific protein ATS3B, partial [Mucuna pruriens]
MMKQGVHLLLLFLASGLTLSVSESQSASLLPHAAESFNLSYIQARLNTASHLKQKPFCYFFFFLKNAGSCSYLVVISTSCSSLRYTRDHISISFGDAYGNQIYAPGLDNPASGTFESCSSDTFQINGPCAYQICYVYLYRSGSDGWKPESVKINSYNGKPVTFYYNTFIPRDTWYGFNLCHRASSAPYQVSMQKGLIFM